MCMLILTWRSIAEKREELGLYMQLTENLENISYICIKQLCVRCIVRITHRLDEKVR
jgi:hypothetical protein